MIRRRETLDRLLEHLANRWTAAILAKLAAGPCRFHELASSVGAPENTLSRVLRALERDGLVERLEAPTLQRQVTYRLSALGQSFHDMGVRCVHWIERHG